MGISRAAALARRTHALRVALDAHWRLGDVVGCHFPSFGEELEAARLLGYAGAEMVLAEEALVAGNRARHAPPPGAQSDCLPRATGVRSSVVEAFRAELFAGAQTGVLQQALGIDEAVEGDVMGDTVGSDVDGNIMGEVGGVHDGYAVEEQRAADRLLEGLGVQSFVDATTEVLEEQVSEEIVKEDFEDSTGGRVGQEQFVVRGFGVPCAGGGFGDYADGSADLVESEVQGIVEECVVWGCGEESEDSVPLVPFDGDSVASHFDDVRGGVPAVVDGAQAEFDGEAFVAQMFLDKGSDGGVHMGDVVTKLERVGVELEVAASFMASERFHELYFVDGEALFRVDTPS